MNHANAIVAVSAAAVGGAWLWCGAARAGSLPERDAELEAITAEVAASAEEKQRPSAGEAAADGASAGAAAGAALGTVVPGVGNVVGGVVGGIVGGAIGLLTRLGRKKQ